MKVYDPALVYTNNFFPRHPAPLLWIIFLFVGFSVFYIVIPFPPHSALVTRIKSCIFIVGEWLLLRIGLHLTGSEKLSLQVTLTLMQQICNYRCVRLFNAIAIKRYRETVCIFNVLKHKSISAFHPLCLMCNKNTKTGNFEFRVRPSCRSHFSWKIFFSCSAKKPDSSGGKQDRDQHLI